MVHTNILYNNIELNNNFNFEKEEKIEFYQNESFVNIDGSLKVKIIPDVKECENINEDINFEGTLIIKGDITPGVKITVNGDVIIEKKVKKVEIKASGNVILKNGIEGYGQSYIKAGKNIYSKFIEDTTINAGNSVIVEDVILHSDVTAINEVIVIGKSKIGQIIGGITRAYRLIRSEIIGSIASIKTILEVGDILSLENKINKIRNEIKENKRILQEIKSLLVHLKLNSNDIKDNYIKEIEMFFINLQLKIKQLKTKEKELIEILDKISDIKIIATKSIHKGTEINLQGINRILTTSYDKESSVFVDNKNNITIQSVSDSVISSIQKKINSIENNTISEKKNSNIIDFIKPFMEKNNFSDVA